MAAIWIANDKVAFVITGLRVHATFQIEKFYAAELNRVTLALQ